MSTVSWTAMRDRCYVFKVMVKHPDGKITYEEHKVIEKSGTLGDAIASGRVVRFYEGLKHDGKIRDFRIIED